MDCVDIGVYIGRFSPFHKGHERIVKDALSKCKILMIFFGSHSAKRTKKDPWLTIERINMVKLCFTQEELTKIKFCPIINYGDIDKWIIDLMLCIDNVKNKNDTIGLFGCLKDQSSYYLNCFPSYFKKMFIDLPFYDGLSATDIRNKYFYDKIIDTDSLNSKIANYLNENPPNYSYDNLDEK